ncbi:MAG: lipase family protein [Magnetococcales bacterium]|nr:lipase family protein [Magnetococcales bacterium]
MRGDQGYAFSFHDNENSRLIVAFRGTVGNVKDWARNFKFLPNSQGIHTGFWEEWLMFRDDITACVRDALRPCHVPVYFCGHSQGGATAIIASKAISDALVIPVSCIAYGAPRAGNKDFRNAANIAPIDCTTVIHGYDLVTTLPPDLVGARQPGRIYWLWAPIWHKLWRKIADHLPEHYDEAIKREMRKRYL